MLGTGGGYPALSGKRAPQVRVGSGSEVVAVTFAWATLAQWSSTLQLLSVFTNLTAVGSEPTPLRTGAWSQRLRPLGQTVTCTHAKRMVI